MIIKNFIFNFTIIFLFWNVGNASDYFLKNKEWVAKKNLTKPIKIIINGEEVDLDQDTDKIITYFENKPFDYFFLSKSDKILKKRLECSKQNKKNIYDMQDDGRLIELPSNLTWSEDPFKDRNWQFELHSFKFTQCLLSGYTAFKDEWYLNRLKFMVSDWWHDNFKSDFPSKEFSWYNHTIPNRLNEFLRIFELLRRNNALDENFTRVSLRAIYWHARILAEEKPLYMKNHNHGLVQSYVLFEVSQLFPEFTLSQRWEEIARKRLENEVSFALTSEGVHKENSPGYHMWVAPYCAKINKFSKHYTGKSITKNANNLENGGLKFITTITRPDGTLPIIGDTLEGKRPKAEYPDVKNLSFYPYFQYVVSNGNEGEKPKQTVSQFPESGYYIYRDKWDDKGEDTATQLILKCSFLAIGHRHNDDGNILLYGLGEDWLVDTGIYGYKYDEYRKYATSASAHNISFPYSEKVSYLSDNILTKSLDKRFGIYKNNWGLIESDNNHVICESHMFSRYTYKRTMKITGKRSFNLTDSLIPETSEVDNNVFLTIFRVPDNKKIYINTTSKIVLAINTSGTAGLEIKYKKPFKNITLFHGENDGITSLKTSEWQKMKPIKTIAFIDQNKSYSANFELSLIKSPSLEGFKELPVDNNALDKYTTRVLIQEDDKNIIFLLKPKSENVQIAFYVYKDNKRIDTQWYSKNLSYKLEKQKFGKGKYKVGYFIISDTEKKPTKSEKKESGYSKVIEVK